MGLDPMRASPQGGEDNTATFSSPLRGKVARSAGGDVRDQVFPPRSAGRWREAPEGTLPQGRSVVLNLYVPSRAGMGLDLMRASPQGRTTRDVRSLSLVGCRCHPTRTSIRNGRGMARGRWSAAA